MGKHYAFLFTFLLLLPLTSFAQSTGSLSLVVEPIFPEAGEEYTVISSTNGNSAIQAKQSWFVNGSEVKESANEKQLSLIAGENMTHITSRITFADGTYAEKSVSISPVRIDLLVSAQTRTPSFYKGASLPSSGSQFSVSALVFKNDAQLSNLSYLWSINGKAQNAGPVRNKTSVRIASTFEKEMRIGVEIFDGSGKKIASDSVAVPIVEPEMYFYELNPLRGLGKVALKDGHIFVGEEMTLRGEAYYMQDDLVAGDNHLEWKINGRPAQSSSADGQEIVLEKKGGSGGATLSFEMVNLRQLLQGVKGSLTLRF